MNRRKPLARASGERRAAAERAGSTFTAPVAALTAQQPSRRCGKRYATDADALTSKRGLTGNYAAIPCQYGCGGWHLEDLAGRRETLRKQQERDAKAPRDTGPSRKVRALVLERDGYACACCGLSVIGQVYSLQHRKRRSQGGSSLPSNLLTVLGDGTRGCHARIDSRIDPHDEAKGYTVRSGNGPESDPLLVSVMYFDPGGGGFQAWLGDDGSLSFDGPVRAEAVA